MQSMENQINNPHHVLYDSTMSQIKKKANRSLILTLVCAIISILIFYYCCICSDLTLFLLLTLTFFLLATVISFIYWVVATGAIAVENEL